MFTALLDPPASCLQVGSVQEQCLLQTLQCSLHFFLAVQTEQAKDQGSNMAGKAQDNTGSMTDTLGKKADEAKGAAKDTVRTQSALVLVHCDRQALCYGAWGDCIRA